MSEHREIESKLTPLEYVTFIITTTLEKHRPTISLLPSAMSESRIHFDPLLFDAQDHGNEATSPRKQVSHHSSGRMHGSSSLVPRMA